MISVIITAYKEPKTIGKAIEQILKNKIKDMEIIVIAPDEETLREAGKYKRYEVRTVKDEGRGKPAALNLAVKAAKGEILILTDGDVFVKDDAVKNIIEPFKEKDIGAVSGRPISINKRNNKYGFWAYTLTETANERRIKAVKMNRRFFCSGYLFAIRKKLFPKLDEELLSEDGFISDEVYEEGYRIGYCKAAEVYVRYPDNFKDWIIQKKRSAGGYAQLREMRNVEIRSFKKESFGAFGLLKYISNFKEMFWLIELYLARIYLWKVIKRDVSKKKKSREELWKRVESTK